MNFKIAFIILAILAVLCSLAPAQNSLPVIQTQKSGNNICVLGSQAVTTGNILVMGMTWEGSASTPSVSDTAGNTWSQALLANAGTVQGAVYVATASSSVATTITMTVSGSTFVTSNCAELDGTQYSTTVDVTDSKTFTTSVSTTPNTVSGNAVSTTVNGDFILGMAGGNRNNTQEIAGSGYTIIAEQNNNDATFFEYKVAGAAGSNTVSFSNVNNDVGTVFTVALKPHTPAGQIITNPTLPDGALANAYNFCLQALGGVGSYTWSISSGTLQSGLVLNSSTGCITGTPTAGPTNTIVFQVVGATSGSATQSASLKVASSLNTIGLVQSGCCSGSGQTFTVTAGNVITAAQRCSATHCNVELCSDTIGTVLVPIDIISLSPTPGTGGAVSDIMSIWGGKVTSTGSDTIRCGNTTTLAVAEWSNAYVAADNVANLLGTSASPVTSATLTTVVPNELILSAFACFSNFCTLGANSPFTTLGASTGGFQQYNVATSVTGYTSTTTMSGNTNGMWGVGLIGLRPTAGSPAPAGGSIHHRVIQ